MNASLRLFGVLTLMVICGGSAQAQCTTCLDSPSYRLVYKTVYDQQEVTAYRIEYETQYEDRQVTSYRPVWETEMRERRYQVGKQVAETSEREERRTVWRPVWETAYRDCSYEQVRYVEETAEREERSTVWQQVCETQEREQVRTVLRPVTQTVMQTQYTTAYQPVTTCQTVYSDQGGWTNQVTLHKPSCCSNRLAWLPRTTTFDPATGVAATQGGGLHWVPRYRAEVTPVYQPNIVARQVQQTSYVPTTVAQYAFWSQGSR